MAKNQVAEDMPFEHNVKSAREAIFANSKPKVVETTFKGVAIELRQPSVVSFLGSQDNASGEERSSAKMTIQMVVNNAYLLGTDEKVFEPTDVDTLLGMPMSGEMLQLIQKMSELLDIKVEEHVKN